MRITKTFVSVFLATFIIGFASVLPTSKVPVESEKFEIVSIPIVAPEIKIKEELQILEENNDWRDENKTKFGTRLIETGEGFHGDEIKAKSGEIWTGLFKENDKYFLRSTKIKILRVNDVVVDEPNEKTGKSVIINEKSKALFLVKNAKQLSEGEIKGSFWMNINDLADDEYSDANSLNKNFVQEYDFNGTKYRLSVKSGVNKKGENINALVLEGNGKIQTLHSQKSFEEGDYLGSVYFVGDFDRDNKPDFYFSLYFHDNTEYKNLFLSSEAEKGKLVKKIATFSITGC